MVLPLIKAMRPKQWLKNVFVFAALVFDEKLFQPEPLVKTIFGFLIFCLLSGAVYLINDVVDAEKDRRHPTKRFRPIASGELKPQVAIAVAAFIGVIAPPLSFLVDFYFGLIAVGYLATMIAYCFWLKNIVIVDVFTVAAGFVLRVAAGVALVQAERFSPWLYICTTLLALFISISRRRHEMVLLKESANEHRAILNEYNLRLLDEMIVIVTSSTIVAYSLYTFSAPNLPPNHTMMLTIPLVLYCLFRYLYLIHVRGEGGAPEEVILKDMPLLGGLLLWGIAVIAILYIQ
ncbi:MAG: decaprenyl-phosphate phosphoribosyltransferase [Chloroflexi bacterium]|nr:MAG: decaprenyl-phosphate phosphoribosyltransferase [Chloroflexota bacterium]